MEVQKLTQARDMLETQGGAKSAELKNVREELAGAKTQVKVGDHAVCVLCGVCVCVCMCVCG